MLSFHNNVYIANATKKCIFYKSRIIKQRRQNGEKTEATPPVSPQQPVAPQESNYSLNYIKILQFIQPKTSKSKITQAVIIIDE